ncbi:hypothetical protein FOA52_014179 [Chlamydomonas sp. UWO 241]|nr:hypothetical protein FOA52_014179 [Chlamydomonas sp. UWO 241]
MSKPGTPIKRVLLAGARPGSAGYGDLQVGSSMELLPPDPRIVCSTPDGGHRSRPGSAVARNSSGGGDRPRSSTHRSVSLSSTRQAEQLPVPMLSPAVAPPPQQQQPTTAGRGGGTPPSKRYGQVADPDPPHAGGAPMSGGQLSAEVSALNPMSMAGSSMDVGDGASATVGGGGVGRGGASGSGHGGDGEGASLSPELSSYNPMSMAASSAGSAAWGAGAQGGVGGTGAGLGAEDSAASAATTAGGGSSSSGGRAAGHGGSGDGGPRTPPPPTPPESVASGRAGAGGGATFFTGVDRDFGDDSLGGGGGAEASDWDVGINPMQSPSTSELGEDADAEPEDAETAAYLNAYSDYAGAEQLMAMPQASEYSNPMNEPSDSTLLDAGGGGAAGGSGSGGGSAQGVGGAQQPADPNANALLAMIQSLHGNMAAMRGALAAPAAGDADGALVRLPPGCAAAAPSSPQGGSDSGAAGADSDADGGKEDEEAGAAGAAARMAEFDRQIAEQNARRAELSEYVFHLTEMKSGDGGSLVELPKNYLAMVEALIRKQRGESTALQGWLGPTRYDDLPIAQLLKMSDDDPVVAEGLARIRELDGKLHDKTLEAVVVNRETFPEKYAEEEARRMARHAARVEEALRQQRMKRMRAGQLGRAVRGSTDSAALGGGGASALVGEGGEARRGLQLCPEEEALVEEVLARPDGSEADANPFEFSENDVLVGGSHDGGGGVHAALVPEMSLAALNEKLDAFYLEHEWDEHGGLADFQSMAGEASVADSVAGSSGAADCGGGARPGSSNAGAASVAGGGGGGARPGGSNADPSHPTAGRSSAAVSMHTALGKRDYLREAREAKELGEWERELDTRLRSFKTSDPAAGRLTGDQLGGLVAECVRLSEAHAARAAQLAEQKEREAKERERRLAIQAKAAVRAEAAKAKAAALAARAAGRPPSGPSAKGGASSSPSGGASPSKGGGGGGGANPAKGAGGGGAATPPGPPQSPSRLSRTGSGGAGGSRPGSSGAAAQAVVMVVPAGAERVAAAGEAAVVR